MNSSKNTTENASAHIPYKTKRRRRILSNLKRSPYARTVKLAAIVVAVVLLLQLFLSLVSEPLANYAAEYLTTNFSTENTYEGE